MDIWKILGTEPTIDKKIIRKAYAAKTREIHPEEKPDEFQQLHEAYQAALAYVDFFLRATRGEDSMRMVMNHTSGGGDTGNQVIHTSGNDGPAEETDNRADSDGPEEKTVYMTDSESGQLETENTLISFFKNQQTRVDTFVKHWGEFSGLYRNQEAAVWWKEYLASEEFQSIKEQAQILHLLAEEIDHKFFYGLDEVKIWFWDAYGFQEGEEEAYQGDKQKLWEILYQAYVKQQQNIRDKRQLARYEKGIRIFAVSSAILLFFCIVVLWKVHQGEEKKKIRFLVDYMAERYPETTFSEPEKQMEYGGRSYCYEMYSSAHPDLLVTAYIKHGDTEDENTYLVTENYSQMLLQYYAAQYGLDTEPELYNLLFYSDIEEVDDFCEKVERMFREQTELREISDVSICAKNVVFPGILLQGGMLHFPFAELQTYDLRNVDAEALAASLREAYMLYMFQYEPWNITTEQYRQWGAEYEKHCEEWVDDKGGWHEVYDPETGERLCRLFIPTYEYIDSSRYYYGTIALPTRFITVGSAYYFLQDKEADITVNEDGSGFDVRSYGYITSFGSDPEVEFNDLRKCY